MAEDYDGATIEVLNWEEYNPRTDAKRPTWFRFENTVAAGAGFHDLDCEQKWLWVIILSLVSQKNGQPITWKSSYIVAISGISIKKQNQTIEIFEKFVRLRVSRNVTLRDAHATNERTNERTDEFFDFESAYRRFPGRRGKTPGIKKLTSQVKTQADYDSLLVAIENYGTSRRDQDPKFTMHFSTFAGQWRDWIESPEGEELILDTEAM